MGDISDGDRTFPGVTSGTNNYVGEIQGIYTLHCRAKQAGEPLTGEEQSALRSELEN